MDDESRQQIVDDENLRLLRIGYFISAGLTFFMSILILLYTFVFAFVFSEVAKSRGQAEIPIWVGRLVGAFGGLFVFVLIGIAVLKFLTGQRLKERRSHTFCMVMAAITCLSIPYGTLLGICTLVVLGRPTVRRSFNALKS